MEELQYSTGRYEHCSNPFDKSLQDILHEDIIEQPVRQIKRVRINENPEETGEVFNPVTPHESCQSMQSARRECQEDAEQDAHDAHCQRPHQTKALLPQQAGTQQPCRRPSLRSTASSPVVTKNLIGNEL